jgi:CubicO group peptidase (beta-lactamase class C family)
MNRQRVPGVALAVMKDGQLVKTRAYGFANVELNTPASTNTVFEIASITKPFTAQAVLLLVEDGKLSLEDLVAQFLDDPPDSWSKITVRQLLNHTSGLDRDPFPLTREATGCDFTSREVLERAAKLPLLFDPGTRFSYSNIGYFLLGKIIERAGGRPYAAFLKARIFKPLGMVSSRVNDRSAIIPNRAAGYEWEGGLRVAHPQSPTLYAPAGGIVSTVIDMATWAESLQPGRLLTSESLARMLEPTGLPNGSSTGYGLGWNVDLHRGRKCLNHSGGILGFRSAFLHYPEYRLTVVVLTNLSPADPELMARQVAGRFVSGLMPLAALEEGQDPRPELTRELFESLVGLSDGRASPILTPEFGALITGWQERIDVLSKDLKGLRCFAYLTSDSDLPQGLYRPGGTTTRLWHCRLLTEDGPRFYSFSLTEQGKVCWLDIRTDS